MAEAYNLHKISNNPKEIVLIDSTHSLQECIDKGYFTLAQTYWRNGPGYQFPVITNNQLSTYPYRCECSNGAIADGIQSVLDCSLTFHPFRVNEKIKSYQVYYKGSAILRCPNANWVIFIAGNQTMVTYVMTNYTPFDVTTARSTAATESIFFLAEVQPNSRPSVGNLISGFTIEELKLVNVEYN